MLQCRNHTSHHHHYCGVRGSKGDKGDPGQDGADFEFECETITQAGQHDIPSDSKVSLFLVNVTEGGIVTLLNFANGGSCRCVTVKNGGDQAISVNYVNGELGLIPGGAISICFFPGDGNGWQVMSTYTPPP